MLWWANSPRMLRRLREKGKRAANRSEGMDNMVLGQGLIAIGSGAEDDGIYVLVTRMGLGLVFLGR